MDFLFSDHGHTYAKHTECRDGEPTQVVFQELEPAIEQQPSLEPSGDTE